MMHISLILSVMLFSNVFNSQTNNREKETYLDAGYKVEEFTVKDLLKWEVWGTGIVANGGHSQLIMSEKDSSKGVMIVSPKSYKNNVVLSYDVMALRPATVLIVELLANNNKDYELKLPQDYDGNVEYLFKNVQMYMFAFQNAAHNKPGPFIRKYPMPGTKPLVEVDQQYMQSGIYYNIEVGKNGEKLFLKVDGKPVLETIDTAPIQGGKILLRIRGTAHEVASCLIRNVKIYSRE